MALNTEGLVTACVVIIGNEILSGRTKDANLAFLGARLDEQGIQISLKLPCLVYRAVKNQQPSMQNFIVEAIKLALKHRKEDAADSGESTAT